MMTRREAIDVMTELAAAALVDPDTEEVRQYQELAGEDREFYDAAFVAIEAMRELEDGQWKSVKDELPRDSKPVLVATDEGTIYKAYYDHVHRCWRTTKTMKITHWRKMVRGPRRRN